ncbi:hypothetical protein [Streptomyces sp. R35]|uniref:Uncharacterized protein n=1 Tax=Streptomyces sp. R35 TaxID=3238630 RepID=A0AB39SJD3_9ACTN
MGAAFLGAAVFGGVSLATSANEDLAHGFPPHPTAVQSPDLVGGPLTAEDRQRLGKQITVSSDGSVAAYTPLRDGDLVTIPVTLTNLFDAPHALQADIQVDASPNGQPVNLYRGTVSSDGPLGSDATVITDISVQGAHSIPLDELTVTIRPVDRQS